MKIYQRFISKLFLKNFIILFFALELFFTGIDLMQNFKHLPHSANLQIIYATNIFLNFINYTLPLSLIFAMLTTVFQLIKSNELVSMYALGTSKKQVILPIFLFSLLITLLYISLNASNFVKANEFADSIKRHGEIQNNSGQLFLKSDQDYVYFETLDPINKIGTSIKIFHTEDTDVRYIIDAKEAIFQKDHWQLKDVTITYKPSLKSTKAKLRTEHKETLLALQGFQPQIIDNLFKGKSRLTIQDSFAAIRLLKSQHFKTDKIRANLYIMIAFPLFAPLAILTLFYPLPAQRRSSNLALLSTLYVFGVLMLWGVLFTMAKISTNGALLPEIGIVIPLLLLLLISVYLIYKNR